jgi:hypothetical protein
MSAVLDRQQQSVAAIQGGPNGSLELVHRVDFGLGGNSEAYVLDGWSHTEKFATWTIGSESMVLLSRRPEDRHFLLEMDIEPFVVANVLPSQRLAVFVNGRAVAALRVAGRSVIGFEFDLGEEEPVIKLCFQHPDAARPCEHSQSEDRRALSFYFRSLRLYRMQTQAESALPIRVDGFDRVTSKATDGQSPSYTELLLHLESLGCDCELGMIQRAFDAEPLGLLRFGTTPLPSLLAMLEARFEKLGAPEYTEAEPDHLNEYIVYDTAYGSSRHTWINKAALSPEQLLARELKRIAFLKRKLLLDLEEGEKLFVFKDHEPRPQQDMLRLLHALRRYNPRNALLWVAPHDEWHPSTMVECVQDGLIKAYLHRYFHKEWQMQDCRKAWVTIVEQAYLLWRAERARR